MGHSRLSNVLTIVAVSCAVVITGLLVKRELIPSVAAAPQRPSKTPTLDSLPVDDWRQYVEDGRWIGREDARVVVIEFGDFECPACARFEATALTPVRREYGDRMAVVFRHWPLSYHKFAYPAARASECADAQGRFPAYHDVLYATHDSLGLLPFREVARRAGVPDLEAFDACNASSDKVPAIEKGIADAQAVEATGTPTLLINGHRVYGVPDSAKLSRMIADMLDRIGAL